MKKSSHQVIAGFPELEVWCRRREFVDELVHRIAQSRVFVALQVGFEVFFCEALVDLGLCVSVRRT